MILQEIEMGWAYCMIGKEEECIQDFGWKIQA
jgi:hypothetical protein